MRWSRNPLSKNAICLVEINIFKCSPSLHKTNMNTAFVAVHSGLKVVIVIAISFHIVVVIVLIWA